MDEQDKTFLAERKKAIRELDRNIHNEREMLSLRLWHYVVFAFVMVIGVSTIEVLVLLQE